MPAGLAWPTPPSGWTTPTPSAAGGVYYQGEQPQFTLSAVRTVVSYECRDYWGQVVASGAVAGTTCTPSAPAGGWKPGWYRIYFTADTTHANLGTCAGESNFVVLRDDPRFPPRPAVFPSRGGNPRMQILKAVIGAGTSRVVISDPTNPAGTTGSAGAGNLGQATLDAPEIRDWWANPTWTAYVEPNRPDRRPWVAFDSLAVDHVVISGLICYPATPSIDGAQTFVHLEPGTTSGIKVTVSSPSANDVVETYDNLATSTAAVAALGGSAYVKAYKWSSDWAAAGPSAIGRSRSDGVVQVVQALFPLGISHYEGPINEGPLSAETAHRMRLFQASVHDGDPAAKAIGPTPVSVDNALGLEEFGAAGGWDYCDEIACHFYNTVVGMRSARAIMDVWVASLAKYGADSKPRWDTESNTAIATWLGTYHIRQAANMVTWMVFAEQYRIPRERNSPWYDVSHGFWSFPGYLMNGVNDPNPQVALVRVLAEETFDLPYQRALDFGGIGEDIYVGSIFRTSDSQPGVLAIGAAYLVNSSTVTLRVSGTQAPLTYVDPMGNASTVAVSGGTVTIYVGPEVRYLRLPAGVTVTVDRVLDLPFASSIGMGVQGRYSAGAYLGGASAGINDGRLCLSRARDDQYWSSPTGAPTEVMLDFATPMRTDRVIIWSCGTSVGNEMSVPFEYVVQTSLDGVAWTAQVTVTTPSDATSIPWTAWMTNSKRETWWYPQVVHNLKLSQAVTTRFVRVSVSTVSFGNEPDLASCNETWAPAVPRLHLQEVMVLCDDNLRRQTVIQAGP